MTRQEYSGIRDLSYSEWHRLHVRSECYTMNLDWIEYRKDQSNSTKPKIVCVIEDKDDRAEKLNEWKESVMLQIADALKVPAYIVYHNICRRYDHRSLWQFKVVNLLTKKTKTMNEDEYRQFIEGKT